MTSDRKGFASGLDKKQKIVVAAVVVVVGIVIYMVFGMFSSGNSDQTIQPTATQQKVTPKPPGATPNMTATTTPGGATMPNNPMNPQPEQQAVQQAGPQLGKNTDYDQAIIAQVQQQKDYLKNVDKLQMLKIQRDIAETSQAIAAADLATKAANKSMGDLDVKPMSPAIVPASDYANRLGAPVQQGAQVVPANLTADPTGASSAPVGMPAMAQPMPSATYVVISVSMVNHRWSAVLGNGGKLYNVSIGDILPVDSSVVSSINREGVTLKKDGSSRRISLVPVI